MSDHVLVHGAWHSGQVWKSVVEELERRGHRAVAPTLASDDLETGAAEMSAQICEEAAALDDPTVVGHTTAAAIIPLLPSQLSVRELVYVNPLLPAIGESIMGQVRSYALGESSEQGRRYDRDARSFWADREAFRRQLAADLPKAELERVWNNLRPQSRRLIREVSPLTEWPDVPTRVLLYADDADLSVEYMGEVSRERLGTEPEFLPGSQLGYVANPVGFVDALLGAAG